MHPYKSKTKKVDIHTYVTKLVRPFFVSYFIARICRGKREYKPLARAVMDNA